MICYINIINILNIINKIYHDILKYILKKLRFDKISKIRTVNKIFNKIFLEIELDNNQYAKYVPIIFLKISAYNNIEISIDGLTDKYLSDKFVTHMSHNPNCLSWNVHTNKYFWFLEVTIP